MTGTMDSAHLDTDADRLQVSVAPGPYGSAHVTVSGEVDLHDAGDLRGALLTAVTTYRGAITVDLHQVTFCDCAGLNALLSARNTAEQAHRSLRVTATSHTVERLLQITETRSYLT
ncbi:STAS domain-containing protein [Streptomyces sp. NBC_00555]|uniref:STAS domain-containing protein n=1 Tax=Streptomyces sp. NBC_00555 TaxID=2903662 RepID=UPI00224D189C|nr:STAS domain-containing protein [Streptomyces sp. NBC_00555]MCX5015281.1 STAS domain-containing protein [Streptomyces sp. NBC_00555]